MIVDGRSIPGGTEIACDVCIVGSGAAGISLAHKLAGAGAEVVLLEAGGKSYSGSSQAHFDGEVINRACQSPLTRYRVRQLGGTTNVWGGRCAPYDDIDFEPRPYVTLSGWPIRSQALVPYYLQAQEILELGEFHYSTKDCLDPWSATALPGARWRDIDDMHLWRFSPPVNFRMKYRVLLKTSRNLRTFLNAPCLELRTSTDGRRVSHAVVGTAPDKRAAISARVFVIAAGGLESARLLLLSRDNNPTGLGNQHDQVGRYFMTHLYGNIGKIHYLGNPAEVGFGYRRTRDGIYARHMFTVRPEAQRRHGLLNFCIGLADPDFHDSDHHDGILSAMFLTKALLARRLPIELTAGPSGEAGLMQFMRHALNVVHDAPRLSRFSLHWIRHRILSSRKLPGIALYSASGAYCLLYSAEQVPNPDSRVNLSQKCDVFGCNCLRSDWRYTEQDVRSIIGSYVILDGDIRTLNDGCIKFDADFDAMREQVKESMHVGSHHIGTTRMSRDPRTGVVDAQCRVHGVSNLYVAGSSVFPTSSCMSPTLTIVATALRVADAVRDDLRMR